MIRHIFGPYVLNTNRGACKAIVVAFALLLGTLAYSEPTGPGFPIQAILTYPATSSANSVCRLLPTAAYPLSLFPLSSRGIIIAVSACLARLAFLRKRIAMPALQASPANGRPLYVLPVSLLPEMFVSNADRKFRIDLERDKRLRRARLIPANRTGSAWGVYEPKTGLCVFNDSLSARYRHRMFARTG